MRLARVALLVVMLVGLVAPGGGAALPSGAQAAGPCDPPVVNPIP